MALVHDTPGLQEALEGRWEVDAIEIGADDEVLAEGTLEGRTAFTLLVEHMRTYSPEWAQAICDVPAATMRKIANEFIDHACVGQTIEIEGQTMPYRPVAVTLGKTVNNGWGGFECCLGAHGAGHAGRRARGAGRHAGHHGAADAADVASASRA